MLFQTHKLLVLVSFFFLVGVHLRKRLSRMEPAIVDNKMVRENAARSPSCRQEDKQNGRCH